MDSQSPIKSILKGILQNDNSLLNKIKYCPFSKKAKTALIRTIKAYIEQLVAEAVRRAQNDEADIISAIHIKKANDYLIHSPKTKLFSHIGTLGVAVFGAFLSTALSVIFTREYYTLTIIFLFISGIMGVFMIILHFLKDS